MRPMSEEITAEVFQVGGPRLTAVNDAAIYLIAVGDHAALIDAGTGAATERLLANIASLGIASEAIENLLLTHCHFDHTGGAAALRGRLGCPVIAHAADAPFIEAGDDRVTAAAWYGARMPPCPVDCRLSEAEETIPIAGRAITAVHIPGHSPGSVAYVFISAGKKIVFAQDVHGPLHPALHSNRADYEASLRRLIALEADILCEGHYGIFHGPEQVATFIASFLD